jgi:hypothetical protein
LRTRIPEFDAAGALLGAGSLRTAVSGATTAAFSAGAASVGAELPAGFAYMFPILNLEINRKESISIFEVVESKRL